MFTSPILRSTVSLGSQIARKQAPAAVKFTVNTSTLATYGKLYASKVPVFFQWATLLSAVMFWPLAAQKTIELAGGINTVTRVF